VTTPAGVAVVRNRIGFLPALNTSPTIQKNLAISMPPKRSQHLSSAREAMTTSSIPQANQPCCDGL
jgi:hypothetical protein